MSKLEQVVKQAKHFAPDALWYLATPYARYPYGRELAFEHATRLAGALITSGVAVFCPIAHSHHIHAHVHSDVSEHGIWLPLDEKFMERCAGVIIATMDGWMESKGVQHEYHWAIDHGKPILFLEPGAHIGPVPAKPTHSSFTSTKDEIATLRFKEEIYKRRFIDSGIMDSALYRRAMAEEEQDVGAVAARNFEASADEARAMENDIAQKVFDPERILSSIDGAALYQHAVSVAEKAHPPIPDGQQPAYGDSTWRQERPLARGVLDYFPDALMEVAHVSFLGNVKHNGPNTDPTWARGKSQDHADCAMRHLKDRGKIDHDTGASHSGEAAWRILALLQEECEAKRLAAGESPMDVYAPASRFDGKTAAEYFNPPPVTKDNSLFQQSFDSGLSGDTYAEFERKVKDSPLFQQGYQDKDTPLFRQGYAAGLKQGYTAGMYDGLLEGQRDYKPKGFA